MTIYLVPLRHIVKPYRLIKIYTSGKIMYRHNIIIACIQNKIIESSFYIYLSFKCRKRI